MVKESIDVLGLLRKRGVEGNVDFLREALAVLVQAIMEAEVTEQVGADLDALAQRARTLCWLPSSDRNQTWPSSLAQASTVAVKPAARMVSSCMKSPFRRHSQRPISPQTQ